MTKLKVLILLVTLTLTSGCSLLPYFKREERPRESCIINIDSKTLDNSLIMFDSNPFNMEIYFVRNPYLIENNNAPLTNALKSFNIQELSNYAVISRNSYEIIPGKKIRDGIEPDKKSKKAILVLKKEDRVQSYKVIDINPKKTVTINIELIGKTIKVREAD